MIGIVIATVLGTLIGIGRLSRNFLVRGVCSAYVELFRNIPVLLQLFVYLLYRCCRHRRDPARARCCKGGCSSRCRCGLGARVASAIRCRQRLAIVAACRFVPGRRLSGAAGCDRCRGAATAGRPRSTCPINGGAAADARVPGAAAGLTIYTAAFIAEIVRAGIQAVPRGQTEAASALGLSREPALQLVLLPQALRVIIPPLTNQYLNLTKNSSLAVAIGYPDLVSISNTTLNQTGRAVECITIIMAVYLALVS